MYHLDPDRVYDTDEVDSWYRFVGFVFGFAGKHSGRKRVTISLHHPPAKYKYYRC